MSVFLPAHDTARGGGGHIQVMLAAPTTVPWPDRRRLAAAINSSAARAGGFRAHAAAGPEGISVAATVAADDADMVTESIAAWVAALPDAPVPPPLPPMSMSDLLTALTFETSAPPASDAEMRDELASLHLRAVVVGDDTPERLDALHARLTDAVVPSGDSPDRQRPTLGRTGRRWACSPVGGSWVRWVRPLPPPVDESEQLARSLANILFGGISRSPFQEAIRRRDGLSYEPRSELTRLDGQHALTIDVPTSPGSEDDVDGAIGETLARFASTPLDEERLRAAATYLLGRTVVERDAAIGMAGERAAIHLGVIPGLLDVSLSPDVLAEVAVDAGVGQIIADLYQPDGFDALVISPCRPLPSRDWTEL